MTKNTLLNIAIIVSRCLKTILIIATIVLTCLFVYAQIDKEAFADNEIVLTANPSVMRISIITTSVWNESSNDSKFDLKPYTFGKLKSVSLFINYFKALIVAVLIFLIIRAFEKIILSVKTLNTFSRSNAKLFRQIGLYIGSVTILAGYTVLRFESADQTLLHISLTPVIYMLLAFIMAEIFKEGESLKQENELTI